MIKFNLKKIMDDKNKTIKDVNDQTGISRNTLSNMYNSKTNGIQFDNLNKLLEALECKVEELIVYKPEKIVFWFEFKNFNYYFHFKMGDLHTMNRFDIDVDYDSKKFYITQFFEVPLKTEVPTKILALIDRRLLDFFYYKLIDFLLREQRIDKNLDYLIAEHEISEFKEIEKLDGHNTIVVIKDGRVEKNIMHNLLQGLLEDESAVANDSDFKTTINMSGVFDD